MEYSSLCWLNASPTNLTLLDNIQKKALKIIRSDEASPCAQLAITSLLHQRQVAATTLLHNMHTCHCPANLRAMLPPSFVMRRNTYQLVHAKPCSVPSCGQYYLSGQKLSAYCGQDIEYLTLPCCLGYPGLWNSGFQVSPT